MKKNLKIQNPKNDNNLIKNVLTDKTVWRNKKSLEIEYCLEYEKIEKSVYIEVYYNKIADFFIVFRSLFDKIDSYIFDNKEEISDFISLSEKYFYLNDFITKTFHFIKNKTHPLFIKNIPPLYYNPIKKNYYYGINYFLIFYNEMENKNQNHNYYYSNANLKEHNLNLFTKKISGTIIFQNEKKYDLLAPSNFIRNSLLDFSLPKNNNILLPSKLNLNINESTENNLLNYFNCVFNQKEYIPKSPEIMAKFILKNPYSFLQILEEIEKIIQEKTNV